MSKKRKKVGFVLLIGLFLLFVLVIYSFFSKKNINKTDKSGELIEGLPTVTVFEEKETVIPQSEKKVYKGKVSGKICYPSEVVPEGDLFIKNVKTEEILKEHFDITKVGQQQNFAITLNEGMYVFAYKPVSNDVYGFFTPCALTMEAKDCLTKESHQLTKVKVEKDKVTKDINICDYYYSNEDRPEF